MICFTNKHKIPFQIDEEYYEIVSNYFWRITKGYVITGQRIYDSNGYFIRGKNVYLHILLFGYAPKGLEWDHFNRDKLDNRRENIVASSHIDNMRNQGIRSNNVTGCNGVSLGYNKEGIAYYKAEIRLLDKRVYLGSFYILDDAIKVRKEAESKYWRTNDEI